MKKKVAIISTNRADIGILHSTLSSARKFKEIHWQLVISGSHLRDSKGHRGIFPQYGIEEQIVPIPLKNDSVFEINQCFSSALDRATKLYTQEKYDAVLVTGDRFEMYAFALAAFLLKIKVFHLHAGEETFGAIDNVFRHSISLFADVHFCSLSQYAKRVKELKKDAKKIFVIGAPSLDEIESIETMSKEQLEKFCKFKIKEKTALVTLHPETYSKSISKDIRDFIKGLEKAELRYIVTSSNVDEGGDIYNNALKEFCAKDPDNRVFVQSLGKVAYFSTLQQVNLMIGNSSSGIIEAASFGLPVVNVGNRQSGRVRASGVFDCELQSSSIARAVKKALAKKPKKIVNPYKAKGSSAMKILQVITREMSRTT